jgi:hypothetical protein
MRQTVFDLYGRFSQMCDSAAMDMSFARRNSSWTLTKQPRITLSGLLAEVAARQAMTPTAQTQAKNDHSGKYFSDFCSHAAIFAPVRLERNQRRSASFSGSVAAMLTESQSS